MGARFGTTGARFGTMNGAAGGPATGGDPGTMKPARLKASRAAGRWSQARNRVAPAALGASVSTAAG